MFNSIGLISPYVFLMFDAKLVFFSFLFLVFFIFLFSRTINSFEIDILIIIESNKGTFYFCWVHLSIFNELLDSNDDVENHQHIQISLNFNSLVLSGLKIEIVAFNSNWQCGWQGFGSVSKFQFRIR